MLENERIALEQIMGDEYVIDMSCGYMEGDRVKIIEGAFVGCEGQIKKLDKRKMTAVIDVEMFCNRVNMTVMLEIVTKV